MDCIQHWHENFKDLRLRLGLTQKQMADLLGVSQSLINLLGANKRHFTEEMLLNISLKCNIDVENITKKREGQD